jgi:hypothetical protein
MGKLTHEHKDKLGHELAVGDAVCYPVSNMLYIGTVIKLNAKMIKVQRVSKSKYPVEHNKYPADIIKLNSSDVTFYILQNQ